MSAPSLATLAADPEAVARLSLAEAVELRREAQRLAADLDAVVSRAISGAPPKAEAGPVLGVKEAAALLGTSQDSLYRKHKTHRLGYICPLDRKLKFREAELAAFVARQGR